MDVGGEVYSVDWSPCGNKLAVACDNIFSDSYSVKILSKEGSTGNPVCQSTLSVDGRVSSIDFAPCGTKIAAAFNIYDGLTFKEGGVKILSYQWSAGFRASRPSPSKDNLQIARRTL